MATDIQVRLQVAKQATHIAGEELRRFLKLEAGKRSESLLKDAEAASRDAMLTFLKQVYPTEEIWGRGFGDAPQSTSFWVIDPLSGHESFRIGERTIATSAAWVENGQPWLGVVANPVEKLLYAAVYKKGATVNNESIGVSGTDDMSDSHLVANLGTDSDRAKNLALIDRVATIARQVTVFDAPALALCEVAHGTYDGFFFDGCRPWDWIAARLILEEAQGSLTDLEGQPLTIKSTNILASNRALHEPLLKALAK